MFFSDDGYVGVVSAAPHSVSLTDGTVVARLGIPLRRLQVTKLGMRPKSPLALKQQVPQPQRRKERGGEQQQTSHHGVKKAIGPMQQRDGGWVGTAQAEPPTLFKPMKLWDTRLGMLLRQKKQQPQLQRQQRQKKD